MEEVTQRPSEPYRVHRCKVLFYLEDDSMQVVEPRDDNSGLSQGWSLFFSSSNVHSRRTPPNPLTGALGAHAGERAPCGTESPYS